MKTTADKIMLGCGVVTVGGYPLGLTRGGSEFNVEREIRNIEADCDRGPVKGRVVIDTEVAKLTVRALETFSADEMDRYYPGIDIDTANINYDEMTGTLTIADGDYNDVTFTGKTKDGRSVTITALNAINVGNIEWSLEDKDEVVAELEFTAHYNEGSREIPPWTVRFGKTDAKTVTFTVQDDGPTPIDGALVTFNGMQALTDGQGQAIFTGVDQGANKPFRVDKGGFLTYAGAVDVSGDTTVTVTLDEII